MDETLFLCILVGAGMLGLSALPFIGLRERAMLLMMESILRNAAPPAEEMQRRANEQFERSRAALKP